MIYDENTLDTNLPGLFLIDNTERVKSNYFICINLGFV